MGPIWGFSAPTWEPRDWPKEIKEALDQLTARVPNVGDWRAMALTKKRVHFSIYRASVDLLVLVTVTGESAFRSVVNLANCSVMYTDTERFAEIRPDSTDMYGGQRFSELDFLRLLRLGILGRVSCKNQKCPVCTKLRGLKPRA